MILGVNSIITLENKEKYMILKIIPYQNEDYYLAARLDNQERVIPSELIILTTETVQDKSYVSVLEDKAFMRKVIKMI